jgi:hypothetical protein
MTVRRSKAVLAGFVVDDLIGRMAARHQKYLRGIEPGVCQHLGSAWKGDVQTLLREIEQVIGIARVRRLSIGWHGRARLPPSRYGAR